MSAAQIKAEHFVKSFLNSQKAVRDNSAGQSKLLKTNVDHGSFGAIKIKD